MWVLYSVSAGAECDLGDSTLDHWPTGSVAANNAPVLQALAQYTVEGWDWRLFTLSGPYVPGGDYLNWAEAAWSPMRWGNTTNDARGVIVQTYDEGLTFVYQPTTIAQYALWLYSDYLHDRPLARAFRINADKLLDFQQADGSLRAEFDLKSWSPPLSNGWTSGIAQAQAISAWLRAYKLFGDDKYLEAAKRAASFMLRDTASGGCLDSLAGIDPSLSRLPIVQEYPGHLDTYTLNDACFAVLALYDLREHDSSVDCPLQKLLETLSLVLPYYSVAGFSAYDLRHIVQGSPPYLDPSYHMLNTALIWAIDTVSPMLALSQAWQTWAQTVNQPLANELEKASNLLISIKLDAGSIVLSWTPEPGLRLQTSHSLSSGWHDVPFSPEEEGSLKVSLSEVAAFFRLMRQ